MQVIRIVLIFMMLGVSANSFADLFTETLEQAKAGNPLAQAKVAAMYQLGRNGVAENTTESAQWMEKAANQGLVEAEVFMAALYDRGLGVKHSVRIATQWYEKAAAKKHGTALAILGRNEIAKGGIAFNYKTMRLRASKQIPIEYSKRFLRQK